MSDHQIGPAFHIILLAVFICNETATCNCFVDVYSRHESDIEKWCLWKHCVKPYMKNFAATPCSHVVITCLFRCLHFDFILD